MVVRATTRDTSYTVGASGRHNLGVSELAHEGPVMHRLLLRKKGCVLPVHHDVQGAGARMSQAEQDKLSQAQARFARILPSTKPHAFSILYSCGYLPYWRGRGGC